jgi:hypothetical protein
MNYYQLYKALRHHKKLSDRRSLTAGKKMSAKIAVGFMVAFSLIYLMFMAVMLALGVNNDPSSSGLEVSVTIMPFVLALDFLLRFTAQQTPSQLVKPYILLPVPKYICIDTFIVNSLLTWENFVWFALFLPLAYMSILFSHGFVAMAYFLLFCLICFMANSQWYSIVRTNVNNNLAYWLLPLLVYAAIFVPAFYDGVSSFRRWNNAAYAIGDMIEEWNPLPLIGAVAVLALLVGINRRLQYKNVWNELSRVEKVKKLKTVSRFSFLDRYGDVGQFIQLEIKSIMRNKNVRKNFINAMAMVLIFALLVVFTDIYDGQLWANFIGIYAFAVLATTLISTIMCYEGNYMDGLMVHKENILTLLRAKYIFACALMIVPFLLVMPVVVSGKWSLLMVVGYAMFNCGVSYFVLFQMAIYNNETIPLNDKLISKNGFSGNYVQMLVTMGCLLVPVVMLAVLQIFFSETTTYIIMLLLGLIFILTHELWLRNIYSRMMKRRYKNMESFRASR